MTEMMKLEFDPEKHEYKLEGEVVPSVTELLSVVQEDKFNAINPAVLQYAAERGTEVHEACESIDYGIDIEEVSPDVIPFLDAYCAFLRDYRPEWYGIEDMVYGSHAAEWGSIDYAGTVDRWGMIDGELAVVDIKTVSSPSVEQKISVAVQTFAYGNALTMCWKAKQRIKRHYALYLKKDGTYDLLDTDAYCRERNVYPSVIFGVLCEIYFCKQDIKDIIAEAKQKKGNKKDE